MKRFLQSLFGKKTRKVRKAPRPSRVRLRLEPLETRLVPMWLSTS